jgi:hypothetical protein
MFWLTDKVQMVCIHEVGKVQIKATQDLVFIDSMPVLVDPNPENRPVSGCPLAPPLMKPCLTTLKVRTGYSDLISIQDQRVCVDSIRGLTDGHPPGTYDYKVNFPGQQFVSEAG